MLGCTETFDILKTSNMLFQHGSFLPILTFYSSPMSMLSWLSCRDAFWNNRLKAHILLVILSRSQVTTWCNAVSYGDGRLNVKLIKLRHLSASILWDTSSYMFWNICAVARLTASTPQASQVGLKDNYSFLSVCWEGFIQRWQHRLYISRQCFESGMNFWNRKKLFIVKSLSSWVDFKFVFFDVKDCLAIKRSPATKDSTIYLLSWGKNLYIVL